MTKAREKKEIRGSQTLHWRRFTKEVAKESGVLEKVRVWNGNGHNGDTGHIAAWCRKGGNRNLCAIEEEDSEHAEETIDIEENLHAWCRLETCENEQRQAVTSRRDKQKMKEANQTSLLSSESSLKLNQKEIKGQSHHGLWRRGTCDA